MRGTGQPQDPSLRLLRCRRWFRVTGADVFRTPNSIPWLDPVMDYFFTATTPRTPRQEAPLSLRSVAAVMVYTTMSSTIPRRGTPLYEL
jgi:hypothetical protein